MAPASTQGDAQNSAPADTKSGRPPPPASPPPALPTSAGAAAASSALGSARQHAWWSGTVRTTHTLYWFFRVRQLLAANFARASETHASDANNSRADGNQMTSSSSVRSASIVALITERTSAFRVPHLPVGASDGFASVLPSQQQPSHLHSATPPLFEASDRFCDPTREAVALFDSVTRKLLRRFSDANERLPSASSLAACEEHDLAALFGADILGLGDARNQSASISIVKPFASNVSVSADATIQLTDIVPEECWLWLLAWLACFEQHVTDVDSPNDDSLGGHAQKDAKQKEKQKKQKKDKKDEPPPKLVAGFYSLYTLLQPLLRLPSIDHARQALAHVHTPLTVPVPSSAQHHSMLFSLIEHSNVLQRRLALLAVPLQRFVTDAVSSAAISSALSEPPALVDANAPAALVSMLSRLGLTDVPKAANVSALVSPNGAASSSSTSSSPPSSALPSTPPSASTLPANTSGCFFSAADLLGSAHWAPPLQHSAHAARRRMRTGLHAPDRLPFALPLHMQTQAVCPSCQHQLSGIFERGKLSNNLGPVKNTRFFGKVSVLFQASICSFISSCQL